MSTFPVLLGVFIFDELVIDKNHTNFATITNTSIGVQIYYTVERKIKIKEKPIDSSPCLVLSREIYVCSFFHGVAQKTTKLTIMNNL